MLNAATDTTLPDRPDPDPEVRALRDSSRRLVRVLGVMHGRVDGLDCTPAQCHALIELSLHGRLTSGELAERLEVDKSTASRTLRPLVEGGLLETSADPGDQRTRPVSLTAAGRERVERIHAVADGQVAAALDLLTEAERATVLAGVSLYERALHRAKGLAGVVVRAIEARDDAAMAGVIRAVMTEFGAVGCGYSIGDAEVDELHRAYAGDHQAYFVAERDGEVLGGGGIGPLAGDAGGSVCELRKMFALPAARGLGLGRRLLDRCLEAAREAGFRTCYLETLEHMHQARALYEKAGFAALEQPMGQTGHDACDSWYALEL
ncbi:MAG: MarR family transcriptional regulator [Planctomycetota bacterium]|nr:MAG: MarR family transcriptional regulator [Planctomycetota bacterium]